MDCIILELANQMRNFETMENSDMIKKMADLPVAEIREALERSWLEIEEELGCSVSKPERDLLLNMLEDYHDKEILLEDIVEHIRDTFRAFGRPFPDPDRVEEMLPPIHAGGRLEIPRTGASRAWALSIIAADFASKDEDVQRFRSEVLNGELIEFDQVESWIKERAKEGEDAGRSSEWLNMVPIPPGHDIRREPEGGYVLDPPLSIGAPLTAESIQFKLLQYAVPEKEYACRIRVDTGGTLERLHSLSERLAKSYRWEPGQATAFLLTGATPPVSVLRARIESVLTTGRHGGMPGKWATRIVLSIDPMLSPAQVKKHYQAIRQQVVGKKKRDMRGKHYALAVFTLLRPEDESWTDRQESWNFEYSEWEWPENHPSNFKREAEKAVKRLLDPYVFGARIPLDSDTSE